MNSIFLVGCPRSGTTLLQSMLASHTRIISFPETHFFMSTMPINPVFRKLKLYGKNDREKVLQFIRKNNYALQPFKEKTRMYSHQEWCRKLSDILQAMAIHDAKKNNIELPACWIEKTPRHLHYISSIEQSGCRPKFLHLLRDGKEVIGSMRLATKKHPEEWNGERSLNKCIRWWNTDIKESLKYRELPNHFFVVYQQLLDKPEKILKALCDFLSVEYQQEMSTQFHQTAPSLITWEEKWKDRNTNRELKKSNKLQDNFDESTIQYIIKKAISVDLSSFYH